MRATIQCKNGKPSRFYLSKDGEAVELTPNEAALAVCLLKEFRAAKANQDSMDKQAIA